MYIIIYLKIKTLCIIASTTLKPSSSQGKPQGFNLYQKCDYMLQGIKIRTVECLDMMYISTKLN